MSWPLNVNKIKNPCGEIALSPTYNWIDFIYPIKTHTMAKYHIVIKFKDPSKNYSLNYLYSDINDAHRGLEYYNRKKENGDDFHYAVEEFIHNNDDILGSERLW